MTRHGRHGGASSAEVAAELGVSERTIRRDTAHALELLELHITTVMDCLDGDRDELLCCLRRLAWLAYVERLAACEPGREPEDDPPPAA